MLYFCIQCELSLRCLCGFCFCNGFFALRDAPDKRRQNNKRYCVVAEITVDQNNDLGQAEQGNAEAQRNRDNTNEEAAEGFALDSLGEAMGLKALHD